MENKIKDFGKIIVDAPKPTETKDVLKNHLSLLEQLANTTIRNLEDRINYLEIENQYLKQKIQELEAKQNEIRN
ncbi:hypothetical protein B4065_3365 [Caldibacillus thermoamylovorans]|uniref:hypothetical protein n=1 Tax=Caldibacillus thermoamylovorans TaxID=35841 RepID=UPI0005A4783D|nr:hypothetical protein [Caldibacillus thermoamylovorans]KIO62145.1 hypothetical protein B4065_3365 [Caldibacillus thermoamylovorans]